MRSRLRDLILPENGYPYSPIRMPTHLNASRHVRGSDVINGFTYDIKRAAFKSHYQISVMEILRNVETSCLPSSIMNDISVHVITDNPVFTRQKQVIH